MENPLVSVILPIYNVEKYLDRCITSVVNQTYKNLEIILIDDGAKDSSPEICEKWTQKDERIVVVHKENAGLGMARNTGLNNAHGKYVAFVDSDDFLEENAIKKLLDSIGDADTILCGHYIYYGDDHIESRPIMYSGTVFEGNDVTEKILAEMMGALPSDPVDIMLPVSVWHGLYSMKIINQYNIRFPSERELISEDMIFDIDYFSKAQKVTFIQDCLYYYRKNNEESLTSVYNENRFNKEIILYNEISRKMSLLMPEQKYLYRVQRTFLGRTRSCIKRAVKQLKEPREEIKRISKNETVKKVLASYPYQDNKISLFIFNYCLKHEYCELLRLMVKIK